MGTAASTAHSYSEHDEPFPAADSPSAITKPTITFPKEMSPLEQAAAARVVLAQHLRDITALENALHAEEARTTAMLAVKLQARKQRILRHRELAKKGYFVS